MLRKFKVHKFIKYRHAVTTVMIIVLLVIILAKCMNHDNTESAVKASAREQFAGSATCANCHKAIYENHLNTAHYHTSGLASSKEIKGSFDSGKNRYFYDDSRMVAMEIRNHEFYQVEYVNDVEKRARRMDIIFGSGEMGQTFATLQNNQLFQLPVSYFGAAHQWSNSPGFPNKIVFNRPITSRCLECHSTFAKTTSTPDVDPESFDTSQMIFGVDCEKCHGPALSHVEFQTQNPSLKTSKYILNPATFSRQQKMDLCTLCHGGRLYKSKPSFSFTAGNKLSDYFAPDNSVPTPDNIDVHGNQNGLLRASKCFKKSETLTCNTCHNTHENERGRTALYSQRCMSCHNTEHNNFCKMSALPEAELKKNCIDCHMPLKQSRRIAVYLPGGRAPLAALIRSHYIDVYPDETKKILDFMKN